MNEGLFRKISFGELELSKGEGGCLGDGAFPVLDETWVNVLEMEYMHSRECGIGSRGRPLIHVRSCGVVKFVCTCAVEEPSHWSSKPLANPSWRSGSIIITLTRRKRWDPWIILETLPSFFSQKEVTPFLSIRALHTRRASRHSETWELLLTISFIVDARHARTLREFLSQVYAAAFTRNSRFSLPAKHPVQCAKQWRDAKNQHCLYGRFKYKQLIVRQPRQRFEMDLERLSWSIKTVSDFGPDFS